MPIIPVLVPPSPKQNHLLAALPEADYQRLMARLEPVQLKIGQPLSGAGVSCTYACFIVSGVVSMLYGTLGGDVSEVAVIGNEGMAGVELFMGGSAHAAVAVKSAGFAYRLHAARFRPSSGNATACSAFCCAIRTACWDRLRKRRPATGIIPSISNSAGFC